MNEAWGKKPEGSLECHAFRVAICLAKSYEARLAPTATQRVFFNKKKAGSGERIRRELQLIATA